MEAKSGVTRRHELERNTRPESHKTRRNYTYAMRDISGASVDVTRVSREHPVPLSCCSTGHGQLLSLEAVQLASELPGARGLREMVCELPL